MDATFALPGGLSLRICNTDGLRTVQLALTEDSSARGDFHQNTVYLEPAMARALGGALIGAASEVKRS